MDDLPSHSRSMSDFGSEMGADLVRERILTGSWRAILTASELLRETHFRAAPRDQPSIGVVADFETS